MVMVMVMMMKLMADDRYDALIVVVKVKVAKQWTVDCDVSDVI